MGLDQYLHRAVQPDLEEGRFYDENEIELDDLIVIPAEEMRDSTRKYLKPFSVPVKLRRDKIALDKIIKCYNLTENADIFGISPKGLHISDVRDGKFISLLVPHNKMEQFTISTVRDVYICGIERIAYWRKRDDISDLMSELISKEFGEDIDNNGFYPVNEAMARRLALLDPEVAPYEFPEHNSNIMYRETY